MKYGAVILKKFNPRAKGSRGQTHEVVSDYVYVMAENKKEAKLKAVGTFMLNEEGQDISHKTSDMPEDTLFMACTSIKEYIYNSITNGMPCATCGKKVPFRQYEDTYYINIQVEGKLKRAVFCDEDCKDFGRYGTDVVEAYIELDRERSFGHKMVYMVYNEDLKLYYIGQTKGSPFYRGQQHMNSSSSALHEYISKDMTGGSFKVLEEVGSEEKIIEVETKGIAGAMLNYGEDKILNRTQLSKAREMINKEKQVSLFEKDAQHKIGGIT